MTTNQTQSFAEMTTRQKVIAGLFVVLVIFLIYEVIGLFKGGSSKAAPSAIASNQPGANGTPGVPQQPSMPAQAELRKSTPPSPREQELMQLQKETEAKYLSAISELQMLKVEKDIAEANKAIMSAKLETVKAEKSIVDTLAPTPAQPVLPPNAYAEGLNQGAANAKHDATQTPVTQPAPQQTNYVVVSVAELEHRWSAVLGADGKLYNVFVGDVLPADGSVVTSISRYGVELQKNGVTKKVSLVSII